MITRDQVRDQLKAFICQELVGGSVGDITDDEPLITGGLIDSFCLAQIGVFIERQFGVYIPDPDLTVERMNTLAQMVARVMEDRPA